MSSCFVKNVQSQYFEEKKKKNIGPMKKFAAGAEDTIQSAYYSHEQVDYLLVAFDL